MITCEKNKKHLKGLGFFTRPQVGFYREQLKTPWWWWWTSSMQKYHFCPFIFPLLLSIPKVILAHIILDPHFVWWKDYLHHELHKSTYCLPSLLSHVGPGSLPILSPRSFPLWWTARTQVVNTYHDETSPEMGKNNYRVPGPSPWGWKDGSTW